MNDQLDLTFFQSATTQVSVTHDGCEEYAVDIVRRLNENGIRAVLGTGGYYTVNVSVEDARGWLVGEMPLCVNIDGRTSGEKYRTSFLSFMHMLRAMNGVPSYGSWFK